MPARLLPSLLRHLLLLLLFLLLSPWQPPSALADCECGYLATTTNGSHPAALLFTDLLETDFTRLAKSDGHHNDHNHDHSGGGDGNGGGGGGGGGVWARGHTGWARQAFNLSRERARGVYGEMFDVGNVRVVGGGGGEGGDGGGDGGGGSGGGGGGEGEGEGEAGLELVVRSEVVDGMVSVAELDTDRLDLRWGTFRAVMKVSGVGGTCAAFFWYFNDTQEIDMEFLSQDFNPTNHTFPINLVLQSREAALAGHDASRTGSFIRTNLPFDPTAAFHEYRIDYLPDRVFFYADGAPLAAMDGPAVPSSPGHLILQHWSNGNARWSGGPPAEDAALVVRSVKAYFNSSLAQRQRDWKGRCRDPGAPGAVCVIPDVTPGDWSAAEWFFSDQGNMTNNQTITAFEQSQGSRLEQLWWLAVAVGWLLFGGGWAVGL